MIIDRLENLEKYAGAVKGLAPAARFLEGFVKTDMTPGRYELDSDRVFANVQGYEPKEYNCDMLFEAHRKYIDLQAVLSGGERIDWAPLGSLKEESEEYSKGGDIAFYSGEKAIELHLRAGDFTILMPQDAHKPGIKLNDCKDVLKVVVKIAVE